MEPMKVLVAYDGSECSDAAIADLERAGLADDTEALVLTVADAFLPPPSMEEVVDAAFPEVPAAAVPAPDLAHRAVVFARETAERAAERVRRTFPGWRVSAEATADAPGWGIVHKADTWRPDLIVIGSHGRSAAGRLFLGSVSMQVLHAASAPVRIARERTKAKEGPIRLVVGVDGSPHAEAAVKAVARRRWPAGTTADVVGVLGDVPRDPQTGIRPNPRIVMAVEAAVDELRAAGLVARAHVLDGDPKRILLERAEEWDCDALVVGARGLGRIDRLLLGSVSTALATRAGCSVEVVRPGRPAA